jgi:hypothetical protein
MKPAICLRSFAVPGFSTLLLSLLFGMSVRGQSLQTGHFADLRLNEVNTRAVRHFLSHFSPTSPVKWFQNEQYYIATCSEGDSADRIYYKTNGNFDFCIKYYRADALDMNLKSFVFRKFPGCEILTVTELTDLEKKELSIKIKDGSYIRTLSCSDEGIEITENIKDSNS